MSFPASGGVSVSSTLTMSNERISLSNTRPSEVYYDTIGDYPVISFPAQRALVIADEVAGPVMDFTGKGVNAPAFGSRQNNTAISIIVPTAAPTTVFTVPLAGGTNYQQIWKVLVGATDGATNYETYFIDVGVFWIGTTSPHYTATATSNLPPGWSLTVPVITSGNVVFEHTFGSDLTVFVSAVTFGQNIP